MYSPFRRSFIWPHHVFFRNALLALILTFLGSSSAESAVSQRAPDYLDFEAWARANRLQSSWRKRNTELQVTNQHHHLICQVDSRKVQLDGVNLWLSVPIALKRGRPLIASHDLQTLLRPLLFPSKSPNHRVKIVALDSGHGGKDPGNQEGSHQEKKFTLLLGSELARQLEMAGFKVVMTRGTDSFVDLGERPRLADRANADLFVSLHFNSTPALRQTVSGVEVYCFTPAGAVSTNVKGDTPAHVQFPGNKRDPQNILLAYQIQKAMVHRLSVEDRGVRRARWAVLRTAEMPAVLVEAGFMSAPKELKKITDPAYRKRMAAAIAEGIQAYKRLVEP